MIFILKLVQLTGLNSEKLVGDSTLGMRTIQEREQNFVRLRLIKKSLYKSRNTFFDNLPACLKKYLIEVIWTCCIMSTKIEDYLSHFIDIWDSCQVAILLRRNDSWNTAKK